MSLGEMHLPRHMRRGYISPAPRVKIRVHVWCAQTAIPGCEGVFTAGEHEVIVPRDKLDLIRRQVETEAHRMDEAQRMHLQAVASQAGPACSMTSAELMQIPFTEWPERAREIEAKVGHTREKFFRQLTGRDHCALLPTAAAPGLLEELEELPPEEPGERFGAPTQGREIAELRAKVEALTELLQQALAANTSSGGGSKRTRGGS